MKAKRFHFRKYDAAELSACGHRLIEEARLVFQEARGLGTAAFTEFILDWFAAAAQGNVAVDARSPHSRPDWRGQVTPRVHRALGISRRETRGEFLVDLCHSDYPCATEDIPCPSLGYLKAVRASRCTCRIRLALESEWGKQHGPDASVEMVFADAMKVAAVDADARIMIFASRTGAAEERRPFVEVLDLLRTRVADRRPWLYVDLPWKNGAGGQWKPWAQVC